MVLIWFEAVSSLKINLGKSELVPVGVVLNIMLLLDVFRMQAGFTSYEILGSSFGC